MDVIEFKVGESVTYQPYEKKHKAKVIEVNCKGHLFGRDNGNRIFYRLTGRDKDSVLSITTGLSIVESRYFKKNNK